MTPIANDITNTVDTSKSLISSAMMERFIVVHNRVFLYTEMQTKVFSIKDRGFMTINELTSMTTKCTLLDCRSVAIIIGGQNFYQTLRKSHPRVAFLNFQPLLRAPYISGYLDNVSIHYFLGLPNLWLDEERISKIRVTYRYLRLFLK